MGRNYVRGTVAERLWAKVDKRGPDECWPWTAGRTAAGYGQLGDSDGTKRYAHRAVYELTLGPIPDGAQLDHTCHNADPACAGGSTCLHRRCVNPAHLEVVTQQENIARGRGHGSETHCPAGHPYDEANTYRPARGGRLCRACARDRDRQRVRPYDPEKRRAAYERKKARAS